jgi:ADP-ribosylglycohydrolase
MFMAAAHAASLSESSTAACADAGLSVVPERSRLAEALRAAREVAGKREWEAVVDELYARYGHYHWVHAINNTALVAAALYAFDGDFSGAISAVVQGGWDTDTNGAAVGSILGAIVGVDSIDERWSAPLKGRFASSLPGFDGIAIDELVARTLAVVVTPARV